MKKNKRILLFFCLVGILFSAKSQGIVNNIDSTQYAIIYVYRPFSILSPLMGFGIRNNDKKLFKLRNNSVHIIKIYQPGTIFLSAKSIERKSKIVIEAELGKSYYLKCKPRLSYLSVNPKLLLVEAEKGKQEYQAIVDEK